MPRRRIVAWALSAAAGGLLGVAFLPAATAFADDWNVDPTGQETITGLYGHGFSGEYIVPPAVAGSVQGDQTFAYTDTTNSDAGTFYGFESTSNDGLGDINTEVYVDGDVTGAGGPAVGSVFDTYSFDDGAYTNVYSDVDGTATDTLESSSGDIAIPTTFDAANGLIADAGGVPIGADGDEIIPLQTEAVDAISGIPPLTVAEQGTQDFGVDNASGAQIDSFPAIDTTTTDGLGTYTEAVLATANDTSNTVEAGSIFNTITLGGDSLVYSDLISSSGNVITDTLDTPSGDIDIPVTFDAAQVETVSDKDLTLPDGFTFDPTDALQYTGINGLPPWDVGVQGGQDFTYDGGSESFTADVTNTLDEFNDSTETILVTSSSSTADLPAGSEFEIVNFANGVESVYSDIASATAGQDVISETLVTPLGDIALSPSFDAAAGLANDIFSVIAGG